MNNLAYNSRDAATVGPKIEEIVRESAGVGSPVPYEVEPVDGSSATAGSILGDIGRGLVGGNEHPLFRLHFSFSSPRSASLQVNVNQQGVGTHAGLLLYSTEISKPIGGEVSLEDPKMFGKSKFTGDSAASGKLNANGDLIKRANDLARVESQSGGMTLTIKRCCKLIPNGSGSTLVIASLPRTTRMGFSATVDAREFFDLAAAVEAAL